MASETGAEIRDAIRGWIAKKSGGKVEAAAIADDTGLIEQKILKSLQLMELILWLERFTDDPIDVEMLKPGAFRSIDSIMATFFPREGVTVAGPLLEAGAHPELAWRESGQSGLKGSLLGLFERADALFLSWAADVSAEACRYGSFLPAKDLQRIDYLRSFPHLATFPTTLARDDDTLKAFAAGEPLADDGSVALTARQPVKDVLTPAACYHLYADLKGQAFDAPKYLTTVNTCYRCEEHYAPLERQWCFTMREIVCIGSEDEVRAFLARYREKVAAFFEALPLPIAWEHATDPFFNPSRNPKFIAQKLEPVKHEMVFTSDDTGGEARGLSIGSINFHRDYFGDAFELTRDGEAAYSGCVAFGLERWVLAILKAFGADPAGWPEVFRP